MTITTITSIELRQFNKKDTKITFSFTKKYQLLFNLKLISVIT